jgi:hypothetical protein
MKEEAVRPLHGGTVRLGQTQSKRIKVNQTKSNQIKPVTVKCLWRKELHWSVTGCGGVLGLRL